MFNFPVLSVSPVPRALCLLLSLMSLFLCKLNLYWAVHDSDKAGICAHKSKTYDGRPERPSTRVDVTQSVLRKGPGID